MTQQPFHSAETLAVALVKLVPVASQQPPPSFQPVVLLEQMLEHPTRLRRRFLFDQHQPQTEQQKRTSAFVELALL